MPSILLQGIPCSWVVVASLELEGWVLDSELGDRGFIL